MAKLKRRTADEERGQRIKSHQSSDDPPDLRHPAFSFRYLVNGHGIDECTDREKSQILDAIYRRCQLCWRDLRQADRHKLGYEQIARTSLKVGVPRHVTDDVTFIAFRCIGMAPMIGYRGSDNIFYVLWIDRAFGCYDHG